jgi:hypothetical protein
MPTDYYNKNVPAVSLYCATNIIMPTCVGIGRNIFNSITTQRSPQKILKPPATLIYVGLDLTIITINTLLFLKVRDFRILCGKISKFDRSRDFS